MKRNYIYTALIMVLIFGLTGCETVPKKVKDDITGIKTRVDTLESRVEGMESKQATDEFSSAGTVSTNVEVKSRRGSRMRDIQSCLKKAGFYDGPVDGIKGKATRKAVKDFQKANGLVADGVVGNKTWDAMAKYLTGDENAGAAGNKEEGAVK